MRWGLRRRQRGGRGRRLRSRRRLVGEFETNDAVVPLIEAGGDAFGVEDGADVVAANNTGQLTRPTERIEETQRAADGDAGPVEGELRLRQFGAQAVGAGVERGGDGRGAGVGVGVGIHPISKS